MFNTGIAIGRPAEAIVEYALKHAVDIIVVGASSHGSVHAFVLGSVVSKVTHTADVPVTVVK